MMNTAIQSGKARLLETERMVQRGQLARWRRAIQVFSLLGGWWVLVHTAQAQSAIPANSVSRTDEFSMSADGNRVAFISFASNLTVHPTKSQGNVFVRNLVTGANTLVSVNAAGNAGGNAFSGSHSISADGTKVAFSSFASDLVPNDTNNEPDIFVRDLVRGTTTLVSVSTTGTVGNKSSYRPSISADGSKVAFSSDADNLLADEMGKGGGNFVRDLAAGVTIPIKIETSTNPLLVHYDPPRINADGTRVAFLFYDSSSPSVPAGYVYGDIYVQELATGKTTLVSETITRTKANGQLYQPSLNADGTKVVFRSEASNLVANDTNNNEDIFVRDLTKNTTILISVNAAGAQGNNTSPGPGFFFGEPSISADGNRVAFHSDASNLVPNDTNGQIDIFVRDLVARTTTLVSVNTDGTQGNNASTIPSISASGTRIAFTSDADNLIANDSNSVGDVFVRDLAARTTALVSVVTPGLAAEIDQFDLILGEASQTQQAGVTLLSSGVFSIAAPGVLTNDSKTNRGPLSTKLVAAPQHGRIQVRSDGSFFYLPSAGYVGADVFAYQVSDGQNNSQAQVRLTIIDRRAPELRLDTPPNRANLPSIAEIKGRVRDKNSGLQSISLLWRRFDGTFWNGSAWAATATQLSLNVQGINWIYQGALPTPGRDNRRSLLDGSYELTVTATDNSNNVATVTNQIVVNKPTPTGPLPSDVRFSSAVAVAASGTITLRFTGALDAASARDLANFRVKVNGVEARFTSAASESNTISLSGLALSAGDNIELRIGSLRDVQNKILASGTIQLIVR